MDIRENPPAMIRLKAHKDLYQQIYDELTSNNVQLQTQDRYPLALMAINLHIVDLAMKDIKKNGMMIKVQGDRNTITKPNPALNAMKDAQASLKSLFKEFRMTPASRPKWPPEQAEMVRAKMDGKNSSERQRQTTARLNLATTHLSKVHHGSLRKGRYCRL